MNKLVIIPLAIGIPLLIGGSIIWGVSAANAYQAEKVTKTYDLEDSFEDIQIDVATADIDFILTNDGTKKVVSIETDKYYHQVSVEGNALKITFKDEREWVDRIFSLMETKLEVYLPASSFHMLDLNCTTGDVKIPAGYSFNEAKVHVSTGNVNASFNVATSTKVEAGTGNINLSAMSSDSMDIAVSTGRVNLDHVSIAHDLKIKSSTGDIAVKHSHAYNMNIESSTGDQNIEYSTATKNLTIKSSTGDVKFDHADAENILVNTSTGDVQGSLQSAKIFKVSRSTGGGVHVPDTHEGGNCEIHTTTGRIDITIEPLSPELSLTASLY